MSNNNTSHRPLTTVGFSEDPHLHEDDNGYSKHMESLIGIDKNWKNDFPIFQNYPNLVYLDSAATSQKPQSVIDAVTDFYTTKNANVHRGIYDLAEAATETYESARTKVGRFINAPSASEVIFTGNASEAINLVAFGWARKFLQKDDVIVLSVMEHHSNIVPWQRLRDEIGVKLHFLPIDQDFRLDYQSLLIAKVDLARVKLVTLTQASNVLGTVNSIKRIIADYRRAGIDASYLVDAAQSVPHVPVDVKDLDCDFLVFSGHKMLGPSGIGVLWAKTDMLQHMDPLFVGSHMIKQVTKEKAEWTDVPWKFEVGTGKLEAAVGLGAATDYLSTIGMSAIKKHEQDLVLYTIDRLRSEKGLTIYGPQDSTDRLAVFSFCLDGCHAHDIAEILNRRHIAVRSGHHCAQVLMTELGVPATVRASLYIYNTTQDVDALINGLKDVRRILKI